MKIHDIVHLVLVVFVVLVVCIQLVVAQVTNAIHVGVIMDLESWTGKVSTSCMSIALDDFYTIHGDYKTRLVLHTKDSKMDATGAAFAAMELFKHPGVQVIIGPQKSVQTEFIVDIGEKFQIPIITFSATNPSLYSRSQYFIQATPDDHTQVKAIASVTRAFGWKKVILIHEDTDYGNRLVPHLINVFQDINTHILYRSVLPPFPTDDQIVDELHKLMIMHSSVFIVHMSASFGSQFFLKAKEVGMMTEGYVWIVTTGLMNVLESLEPTVIDSMQGVVGVTPYIPKSRSLNNFIKRWKRKFLEDNPDVENVEMISYGLWAYDTVWALARAAERVGNIKSDFFELGTEGKPPDLLGTRASKTGPKLLQEILQTEFEGLSGKFRLVNGHLQPSAFQILNVVGKGGRDIGFWTPTHGISKDLNFQSERKYLATTNRFRGIIWPGESTIVPKGWVIPVNGKKLRIGVPMPDGFSELVMVEKDPYTNVTKVSGYCIDVFDSAIRSLPYNIPYEYVPFQKDGGESYNDIIDQVYLQNYDAVVGDITITLNRSLYVDFAFPYTDGGVRMIVPLKEPNTRMFLEPLPKKYWLSSMVVFLFTGFVVWVLEQVNEFRGTSANPKVIRIIMSTISLAFRKKLTSFLSKLLVMIWLVILLGWTSGSLVTLKSMLALQQLEPATTDFNDLIKHGDFVGYPKGSFVLDLLKRFGFDESKLRTYSSLEECHDLLSKGSQNGGVAAVFEEIPYAYIFLAKYCSKYTVVGPTHQTDGFGFVFPIGSPLVSDVSKAVLEVTEGNRLMDQERFGPSTTCEEEFTTLTSRYPSFLEISASILVFSSLFVSSVSHSKAKQS
ncbi:hypothetical protein AQUCO_06800033v1 [Aquilegia coerulea]|uniref:Glutamate receptor n=1 Tax=Aquilegia coerulea TaxID=218851 RepID=A0A2G5CCK1_AQUCA|nr:hypothetical protein AQUCO_06800033v1 [Aquilegia coerulea]